jgi:hypothetical protein
VIGEIMNSIVYAVCGKKTHGKDTFANFICSCDSSIIIDHFASDLKATCSEVFGINLQSFYDTKCKEEKFSNPIVIDDYLSKMNFILGIEVEPKGYIANNCRELMQYYGTEYVRSVDDNYWINRTVARITNGTGKTIIISDLRFNKEYLALKKIGAKIIRVERIDAKPSFDSHISENELDDIEVDFHIGTITGKFDYIKKCAQLVYDNNWELLKHYDYRTVINNFEKLKDVNLKILKSQIEYYDDFFIDDSKK